MLIILEIRKLPWWEIDHSSIWRLVPAPSPLWPNKLTVLTPDIGRHLSSPCRYPLLCQTDLSWTVNSDDQEVQVIINSHAPPATQWDELQPSDERTVISPILKILRRQYSRLPTSSCQTPGLLSLTKLSAVSKWLEWLTAAPWTPCLKMHLDIFLSP